MLVTATCRCPNKVTTIIHKVQIVMQIDPGGAGFFNQHPWFTLHEGILPQGYFILATILPLVATPLAIGQPFDPPEMALLVALHKLSPVDLRCLISVFVIILGFTYY